MDEAQAALGIGLLEAGTDQVLECRDGGAIRLRNIEEQVREGRREANGQKKRWRDDLDWWFRREIVTLGYGRLQRGKMPMGWFGRGGATSTIVTSAHLVGDAFGNAARGTILWSCLEALRQLLEKMLLVS